MNLSQSSIIKSAEDYFARNSDFENAQLMQELIFALIQHLTEDELMDLGDEFYHDLRRWIDNYDPTPYESPVA